MSILSQRFLNAIHRQPVDATPIWIMRQAGRYLPEYRAMREKAGSFMQLCQTPEWAAEVTLQPLRRYALDAAIIFSDILVIPHAMGLQLHFVEGQGPIFDKPLRSLTDVTALTVPDPHEQFQYVYEAIRLVVDDVKGRLPVIGFAGSPWTLAAYMIQGRSVPQFPLLFDWMEREPEGLHALLRILADAVYLHLRAQVEAGASTVMIFDTWGGLLNERTYAIFSLHYIQSIVERLKHDALTHDIPVIVFTKGGGAWLEQIVECGCDAIGLDAFTNLRQAKQRVGQRVALQGNLPPETLLLSPEIIRQRVKEVLAEYGSESGHIFNLGHGITPDVLPDRVAVLVDAVHEFSQRA